MSWSLPMWSSGTDVVFSAERTASAGNIGLRGRAPSAATAKSTGTGTLQSAVRAALESASLDLDQPIGLVFLGSTDDYLVLEKASGLVKRVIRGVVQTAPALDLAVNSFSERGLLSMALHPDFPESPWVYIRWTESSTGADSGARDEVPLLGNRVDRFVWNDATGTLDDARLAVLADAVEEAGCPEEELLAHLRSPGAHVRGCWAVDLLLSRG